MIILIYVSCAKMFLNNYSTGFLILSRDFDHPGGPDKQVSATCERGSMMPISHDLAATFSLLSKSVSRVKVGVQSAPKVKYYNN